MNDQHLETVKQKLRSIERNLGWVIGDQTECCGVSISQRAVIVELGAKGRTSLVDLAQAVGLDTSTLSRTINGLVNIGLVLREVRPEDRRYISLSLSPQGGAALRRIEGLSDEYFRDVLSQISKEKHRQIVESLTLLSDALEKVRRGTEPCAVERPSAGESNKEGKND